MAVTAQGTTLKFTPQGGEQVTVGKVVSIGEIGGDSQEIDVTTLDSQGGISGIRPGIQGRGQSGGAGVSRQKRRGTGGAAGGL